MIVTVEEAKAQLNQTLAVDDVLIERKIGAAQDHIENLLGFKIEETFGGAGQDVVPESLREAVLQLAAHWYENREAVLIGLNGQDLPFGVWNIVREYRQWSF